MRHKGVKTISVSANRNRISVSGKIGNGVPEGLSAQTPAPSFFYGEKKINQCHNLSLEHGLDYPLKGILPAPYALNGIKDIHDAHLLRCRLEVR